MRLDRPEQAAVTLDQAVVMLRTIPKVLLQLTSVDLVRLDVVQEVKEEEERNMDGQKVPNSRRYAGDCIPNGVPMPRISARECID